MVRRLLIASGMALLACGCSTGPKYCPYCGADLSKAPEKPATPVTAQAPAPVAATTAQPVAVAPTPTANTVRVYQIAPVDLFQKIQQALKADGYSIAMASNGVIETDWKSFEGEFHVARRWQEQTKFRIIVYPDITNPTGASRFDVTEQTQRRSNERASWQSADARPERVKMLQSQLESQVK